VKDGRVEWRGEVGGVGGVVSGQLLHGMGRGEWGFMVGVGSREEEREVREESDGWDPSVRKKSNKK
jgi:hypothetical protein